MSMASARTLYTSSNGDSWKLVRDAARKAVVLHTPNAASGGAPRHIELATFLAAGPGSPECRALLSLIATLVDDQGAADRPARAPAGP